MSWKNSILQWTFYGPMKNLWWEWTNFKSFDVFYPNMGILNFYIWKYLNLFRKSKKWLQWDLNHQRPGLFVPQSQLMLHDRQNNRKWLVLLSKSKFAIKISSFETFLSDSHQRIFIRISALSIKKSITYRIYFWPRMSSHKILINWISKNKT